MSRPNVRALADGVRMNPLDTLDALHSTGHVIATTQQLLATGITPHGLTAAVRSGQLVRVRRGHYTAPQTGDLTQQAVRVGGLLSCISALDALGVWVPVDRFPHIALRHEASRLRSPRNRFTPLSDDSRDGATLHWWPLVRANLATQDSVHVIDALRHAIRCQPWYLAVAALDSALHKKVIHVSDLAVVFDGLPHTHDRLRNRVNAKCESGIESVVRLLLEEFGLPYVLQRRFRGIGFVDFLVAGCVVIETDGRLGHEGESGQLRDYDRDAKLVARGFTVLRFNYWQVMFEREVVVEAIVAALRAHRSFSGVI
jgi:very-short-patch-repair endonuclease